MKYPALHHVVGSDLYVEAAPRKPKELKEAEKAFDFPEISEASTYIAKTKAYGNDWWDLTISWPVSANFLKAKGHQLQVNEFMKYGTDDPIDLLITMMNQHLEKTLGVRLGQASVAPEWRTDRAKGGMKTVRWSYTIRDAVQAYALGMDLTQWSGGNDVVKTKEEYQQRLKDANLAKEEGPILRKKAAAGEVPEEQWKKFIEDCKAKGMSWEIWRSDVRASVEKFPALAALLSR